MVGKIGEAENQKQKFEADLDQFTGTEHYYRHWAGKLKLTDGTHFLEMHGAGWLVDAVASYQGEDQAAVPFQLWKLEVSPDKKAALTMREDSGQPVLIEQKLRYTDFPLDELALYVIDGVLLLPSEY